RSSDLGSYVVLNTIPDISSRNVTTVVTIICTLVESVIKYGWHPLSTSNNCLRMEWVRSRSKLSDYLTPNPSAQPQTSTKTACVTVMSYGHTVWVCHTTKKRISTRIIRIHFEFTTQAMSKYIRLKWT